MLEFLARVFNKDIFIKEKLGVNADNPCIYLKYIVHYNH